MSEEEGEDGRLGTEASSRMKMEGQDDLDSRIAPPEEPHIHHHHYHHHHYHSGGSSSDGSDLHFHHRMYWTSSLSRAQSVGFPGYTLGGGLSSRADGLSPTRLSASIPIGSPSSSSSSGSGLGSAGFHCDDLPSAFDEIRVGREERLIQEPSFLDRLRDFSLGGGGGGGGDPRVSNPTGIAPTAPVSALGLTSGGASPCGAPLSQNNRTQLGYGSYGSHSLPSSFLFDEDERTSLSPLTTSQHPRADTYLCSPWPANSPYGSLESGGRDSGVLGRNSQSWQNLGGGNLPYSIYNAGLDSSRNVDLLDYVDLSRSSPARNRFPEPTAPFAGSGLQQLRSPRSREAFGSERRSIIGHSIMRNPLSPLNHNDALWFDGRTKASCGKECILRKATHKYDSQSLQRDLTKGKDQVNMIFNCAINHPIDLMVNGFGNYLMQKLFEVCTQEQLMVFLLLLAERPDVLIKISLNNHGTRSLQKLIDCIKTRQQIKLVIDALQPGILELIKDPNGSHVLHQCLRSFTAEDNKFIFEAAAKNALDIATHKHACCVLQKCISQATGADQDKLFAEISAHGYEIAQDPYGNYVIQYILELDIPSANQALAAEFKGKYAQLSTHKFGSNVVEKCLEIFDEADQATIVLELISVSRFDQLMQDPFANYVIKSALVNAKDSGLHEKLKRIVLRHEDDLKTNPYCKRIFSRAVLRRFP